MEYKFSMPYLRLHFYGWKVLSVPIGSWETENASQRSQKPNHCMLMLDGKPVGQGKLKPAPIDPTGTPFVDLEAKMGEILAWQLGAARG